jgi:hypothetical protein
MLLPATKKAKKKHRHAETLIVLILPFGSAFSKPQGNLQAFKRPHPGKLQSSSAKYHRWRTIRVNYLSLMFLWSLNVGIWFETHSVPKGAKRAAVIPYSGDASCADAPSCACGACAWQFLLSFFS